MPSRLPAQPDGVPWPTHEWPVGPLDATVDGARLQRVIEAQLADDAVYGRTLALVVVHRGRLVVERYAPGIDASATQRSWSMAKSVTHALVGLLVGDGLLDVDAPAAVPAWAVDARAAITLEQLLRMVDGLAFVEHDPSSGRSDAVDMVIGRGRDDTAAYAEARALAHQPGTTFNYSSGTSAIVSAIVGRRLGGRDAVDAVLRRRLFDPIGMRSAVPRFDAAGTFVGSSYVFATARDFARFAFLYLRDGAWDGTRLLPVGWVEHARRPTPASAGVYGAHWWLDVGGPDTFCAKGYEGQYALVVPERDLVIVRLGRSSEPQRVHVEAALREMRASFAPRGNE